jgi:hypothetical protein
MFERSDEPIFGEAAEMHLPAIGRAEFLEYPEFQFHATGKPAEDDALDYILNATNTRPRSTQQIAWECWVNTAAGGRVTLDTAIEAHDKLVQSTERSEFSSVVNLLANGDDGEVNEVRARHLVADRGGRNVSGRSNYRL